MGRGRRRADRIRQEIPIIQVLYDLGYRVRLDGGDREQQFPCDLHGDGSDNKPSARVYPDSNSWYCFACSKPRDAITTLRDRMDLGFSEACKSLEKKYGLPSLPWSDEDEDSQKYETISSNLRTTTFEQAHSRIHALLEPRETLSGFVKVVKTGALLREGHRELVWKSPLHMKGLLFDRSPKISPPLKTTIPKKYEGQFVFCHEAQNLTVIVLLPQPGHHYDIGVERLNGLSGIKLVYRKWGVGVAPVVNQLGVLVGPHPLDTSLAHRLDQDPPVRKDLYDSVAFEKTGHRIHPLYREEGF